MRKIVNSDKTVNGLEKPEQPTTAMTYIPAWFSTLQNEILHSKREKHGSISILPQPIVLYENLKIQLGKLRVALDVGDTNSITRRAAHVANYAMLIAKVVAKEDVAKPPPESPPELPKAEMTAEKFGVESKIEEQE